MKKPRALGKPSDDELRGYIIKYHLDFISAIIGILIIAFSGVFFIVYDTHTNQGLSYFVIGFLFLFNGVLCEFRTFMAKLRLEIRENKHDLSELNKLLKAREEYIIRLLEGKKKK